MITTTDSRITYVAGGASPNFAVPFTFYNQLHLEIYQNGTLKSIGTHYTVTPEESTPNDPIGGTVIFVVTPPLDDVILILRHVPQTQLADLKDLSIFPADIVEQGLDLLTMQAQENRDLLGHSLSHALTIPIANDTTDTILPDPADAANHGKVVRVNADGTGFEYVAVTATDSTNPLTTQGDLLGVGAGNIPVRIPIASNHRLLMVETAEDDKVQWTDRIYDGHIVFANVADPSKTLALQLDDIDTSTTRFWNVQNKTITVAGLEDVPVVDNPILNGQMEIWQRGTTFTNVPSAGATTADMWSFSTTGAGDVDMRRSTDVPTLAESGILFNYSLEWDVTTADASIAAAEQNSIQTVIEGANWRNFAQRRLIFSFWVKATKTGTHTVAFRNRGLDRSYVATYTIDTTNTWEYKSVVIEASPTTGTWSGANGFIGLIIDFNLGSGSNYHTTAGAWQTGNFLTTSGAVNDYDSTSNFFRITGISLEVERLVGQPTGKIRIKPFADELADCQRFFCKSFSYDQAVVQNAGLGSSEHYFIANVAGAAVNMAPSIYFPVPMASGFISITFYNPAAANGQARNVTDGADCTVTGSPSFGTNSFTITTTGTAGTAVGERLAVNWAAECVLA